MPRYRSRPRSGASAGKSSTATATTGTADVPPYVGRFAPTPSGDLHLGSLFTAVASYLDARAHGGRWLLRIDDLDRPRELRGSAAGILRTLEGFGFEWDGEVVRQSERGEHYTAALLALRRRGLIFECSCSRLQLEDDLRYAGTCRDRLPVEGIATAARLKIESGAVLFADRIQGMFRQDVAAMVGDIILKRRDGIFAYVLGVVVDDAAMGVTHVVRGADLLDNTPRQIVLQHCLGLALPQYAHVPVLTEHDNSKLAKSRRSVNLSVHSPLTQLCSVFSLLGLKPPEELQSVPLPEAWAWARDVWRIEQVPKRLHLRVSS